VIAALALAGIPVHLALRFAADVGSGRASIPLYVVLGVGGSALVIELALRLARGQFGSDLLAGSPSSRPCCWASTSRAPSSF
jgi:hypothetical protein